MRVLWISMNASLYDEMKGDSYGGIGWIGALYDQLKRANDVSVELGMVFTYSRAIKDYIDGVVYYGIKTQKPSGFRKLLFYLKNYKKLNKLDYYNEIVSVINDFKPDIIHLWGVENRLASVVHYKEIPVVAHLQGLLSLYIYIYYPYNTNAYTFRIKKLSIREWILNNGYIFGERIMKHRAEIEKQHLHEVGAVMGRTSWDKRIALFNNPRVKYFQVEETLRRPFYDSRSWNKQREGKFIIYSTISETIYKGFDVVVKAASVLKEYGYFDFEWQIAGVRTNSNFVHWFEKIVNKKCSEVNITCLGLQTPEQIVHGLLNSDLYVHPSYIDNSPNSLCEAQYLGAPCCAANVGGVSSLIEDKVSGVLFPSNAPFDMAMVIKDCYDNEEVWREYAERGKNEAKRRHNPDLIIHQLIAAYKSLINENNSSTSCGF